MTICKHCQQEVTSDGTFLRDGTEDPGDGYGGDASCPARPPLHGQMQPHEVTR